MRSGYFSAARGSLVELVALDDLIFTGIFIECGHVVLLRFAHLFLHLSATSSSTASSWLRGSLIIIATSLDRGFFEL